ncbi:hypothetical protein TCON_1615 [Astathelohania contejeani]|uniref:Uncharacterized protein n=1 Tax=Astathelohania contejeani TaxID=164912 RepID=A0ABQ7HYE2_9MICR|nr:hypothetical protein TCON_1615 [Thelohania contejeani]
MDTSIDGRYNHNRHHYGRYRQKAEAVIDTIMEDSISSRATESEESESEESTTESEESEAAERAEILARNLVYKEILPAQHANEVESESVESETIEGNLTLIPVNNFTVEYHEGILLESADSTPIKDFLAFQYPELQLADHANEVEINEERVNTTVTPADLESECERAPADLERECERAPADLESECERNPADLESECERARANLESESSLANESERERALANLESESENEDSFKEIAILPHNRFHNVLQFCKEITQFLRPDTTLMTISYDWFKKEGLDVIISNCKHPIHLNKLPPPRMLSYILGMYKYHKIITENINSQNILNIFYFYNFEKIHGHETDLSFFRKKFKAHYPHLGDWWRNKKNRDMYSVMVQSERKEYVQQNVDIDYLVQDLENEGCLSNTNTYIFENITPFKKCYNANRYDKLSHLIGEHIPDYLELEAIKIFTGDGPLISIYANNALIEKMLKIILAVKIVVMDRFPSVMFNRWMTVEDYDADTYHSQQDCNKDQVVLLIGNSKYPNREMVLNDARGMLHSYKGDKLIYIGNQDSDRRVNINFFNLIDFWFIQVSSGCEVNKVESSVYFYVRKEKFIPRIELQVPDFCLIQK